MFPEPILRKKCRTVRRVDEKVLELGSDMVETMDAAHGVGLAANQVGALQRVVTIHLPEDESAMILVNPEIQGAEGKREVVEGCLSFPGYEGLVTRSVTVKARWLDENGSKMKVTAEELFAQALEHEIDHLNGILYVDHLLAHEKLAAAGSHMDKDEPHMHDVEVDVHADHSDEDEGSSESDAEVLQTTLKFSELYSDSSLTQMQYDLRKAGYVVERTGRDQDHNHDQGREHTHAQSYDRVVSPDPNLDGGLLLDNNHRRGSE